MILIDSDIVVDFVRGSEASHRWLESIGRDESLAVSGFSAMELVQGCRTTQELRRVQAILSRYSLLWPTPEECDLAFELFARYRLSHGAGLLDTLIAQTAISRGLVLHTFNRRHFVFLPELEIVSPYTR